VRDGTGEFADLTVAFGPLPAGTGEMFANDLVYPPPFPDKFVTAIGNGLADAAGSGIRLIDFRARLIDARYHELDSTPAAFELAARGAVHELRASNPGLVFLEPVMRADFLFPNESLGGVMRELIIRRGQIQTRERRSDGIRAIQALVPLANMLDYGALIPAFAEYRVSISMRFAHHEPVTDQPDPEDDDPRFPGAMGARVA
jgi:elongation factor G